MVSKWGTLFLILMTLPIMGHVVILPLMLDVAGRDGWISIFLSVPLGMLFVYAVFRLRLKFQASDFFAAFEARAGRWIGSSLRMLFIFYFFFLSAFSLAALTEMVHLAFLPETPNWILAGWFMLCCFYAAYKGIKSIALTAGVLAIVGMLTGHSVTAMATPKKEWANIMPFFEFGFAPSLVGMIVLTSIWVELLFLLAIPIENMKEKRLFLLWIVGVVSNGLMMFSTLTGAVMIFGLGQADEFIYPALETVRVISLGFIDRFDIYGMMLMSFGCYIRTSLFFRLGFNLGVPAKIQSRGWGVVLFAMAGLLVFGFAVFLAMEHARMAHTTIYYSWFVFLYPLPFVLLMLARKKKRAKAS